MLSVFKKISKQNEMGGVPPSKEKDEYARYAQEVESALSLLESQLHISDDPQEIAMTTLKSACSFYQADWAGIIVTDLNVNVWSPIWWYNTSSNDRTSSLIREFESSESFGRWIAGMNENEAIMIPDTEIVRDKNPEEFEVYQRLHVHSVLAVPFKPSPIGFLIVRNPQRYIQRSSMLQMLGFVALTSVNEEKAKRSAKLIPTPANIAKDTDVLINLFGSFEIYTSKGVLREGDLKSPKMCRILIYMLLCKHSCHPPREIAEAIWPETDDFDAFSGSFRGLVYRFRQSFSMISDYSLIEATPSGYRLNPELRIITDMERFDRAHDAARSATALASKIEFIIQALSIYKGEIYPTASGEHWISPTSTHYALRYMSLVNDLLSEFAHLNDWDAVNRYASKSLAVMPGNVQTYYWQIYATYRIGSLAVVKDELERARAILSEEEYEDLVLRLKNNRCQIIKQS